jgi:hypothetical protein
MCQRLALARGSHFLPTMGPLPALAHSFDDCIREQIPNVLWKANANQLPTPR